jgi:curved DNA-binding protein CbpA
MGFRLSMNAFELLGFTPRPVLGAEELKARFLERSSPLHPDRVHALAAAEREEATRRFAELNAAHRLLQNPRERLNLLLEMETGKQPRDVQRIPPGTMDLFSEVGQACRDADAFLGSRPGAGASPIQRAAAKGQAAGWTRRLGETLARVEARAAAARAELKGLDARWAAGGDRAPLLEPVENLARLFSYIERWRQQIEDRLLELKVGE